MKDLIIEKQRRATEGRINRRIRAHERGPFLSDDELTIWVPSPRPLDEFKDDLMRYGFRPDNDDSDGLVYYWSRRTDHKLSGKVYSAQAWLDLARKIYDKHWGDLRVTEIEECEQSQPDRCPYCRSTDGQCSHY